LVAVTAQHSLLFEIIQGEVHGVTAISEGRVVIFCKSNDIDTDTSISTTHLVTSS
jgi:hypothetical protein